MTPEQKQRVRHAISFFYDMQKLRIAAGNRASGQTEDNEIELRNEDVVFFGAQSEGLNKLEKDALGYVEKQLKGLNIYERWLKHQKGCGVTMSGFLISEIDINRCNTVSQLWAYFGLAVADDGHAQRRVKGEKSGFDPWRKSKVVTVLADCIIKASGSRIKKLRTDAIERALGKDYLKSIAYKDLIDTTFPELTPSERATKGVTKTTNEFLEAVIDKHGISVENVGGWIQFYDNYKHRKKSQVVPICMNCDGDGTFELKSKGQKGGKKGTEVKEREKLHCTNCNGTGGPAPWGKNDAHRHMAAKRYMMKQFLQELWVAWRTIEGLPMPGSYAERYLGVEHGKSHGPDPELVKAEEERRRERFYYKTRVQESNGAPAVPE
jgi:NADH:ubiquinone oxidoreductase subunit E